jgi:hypothetical protein
MLIKVNKIPSEHDQSMGNDMECGISEKYQANKPNRLSNRVASQAPLQSPQSCGSSLRIIIQVFDQLMRQAVNQLTVNRQSCGTKRLCVLFCRSPFLLSL